VDVADSVNGRVRVHCVIRGLVQGVWFRESTREKAESEGVAGWVKNLPTGEVEAVFEGSREAVDDVVRWCQRGPPSARVEKVETKDETPRDERGFKVLR
jgi:acylphosphatase